MVGGARLIAGAALWCVCAAALGATFTASVDRKELYANEHVLLTLALTDSDTRLRAEGEKPNIDLTLLSGDFELGVPRTDFRFNIYRDRGRSTSELQVDLFPKRSGRLTIPAFTVDGQRTAPIVLQVKPPPADVPAEVFARSGVSERSPWLRAQTVVHLDLYHRINLASAKLGGAIEAEPGQIELYELPQSERTEQVAGVSYNVSRMAWAVWPQRSGKLTLHLPDIWLETRDGRRLRLPFEEQVITVRALPDSVPPRALVGKPLLEQTRLDSGAVGQPITWEVTLRAADGPSAMPRTLPAPDFPAGLKLYLDSAEPRIEPGADGRAEDVAVFRGTLLPLAIGDFTTPAIELPYFDTEHARMALLTVAGQQLHIAPAARTGQASDTASDTASVTAKLPAPSSQPAEPTADSKRWRDAAFALAALWIATLLALLRRRGLPLSRKPRAQARRAATSGAHPLQKRLLTALGARTLEQGLRAWEARHGIDTELRQAVRAVQRLCYARQTAPDEAAAREAVDKAVARLQGAPGTEPEKPDRWSPRAFTPAGKSELRGVRSKE